MLEGYGQTEGAAVCALQLVGEGLTGMQEYLYVLHAASSNNMFVKIGVVLFLLVIFAVKIIFCTGMCRNIWLVDVQLEHAESMFNVQINSVK